MKTRMLLALAMLLILLMAGSLPAAAGGPTVPFEGSYFCLPRIVGVDENGCNIQKLPCEGEATHLGESGWYSDAKACLDPNTMKGPQFGTSIFTAANGDQLIGTFSGVGEIIIGPEGPTAVFSGSYWVTEGTGRLEGYTGSGTYSGTSVLAHGTGYLDFEGTLTKPERP